MDHYAAKIAAGDADAFARLYEKLYRLVYAVALGILGDCHAAEDLTQDTFLAVWQQSAEFRGEGYKKWILTIARNKALNYRKKEARTEAVDPLEHPELFGTTDADTHTDRMVLDTALRRLDFQDRQILLMKNAGMKMKEIATLLQIPRGTASGRYARAMEQLRLWLAEDYPL